MTTENNGKELLELNKRERTNLEKYNNQGCLMKIIKYNGTKDIIVEFQDKYKARVHTSYRWFVLGNIKNPYYPTAYGEGIIGQKYPMSINGKHIKEYVAWRSMLKRCLDVKTKEKHPTYQCATCCDEWLLYENFYEWLHLQENFDKWLNGDAWNLDKDILIKRNKIYSPDTCCLVPHNVNGLFAKRDAMRGRYPIGVSRNRNGYMSYCNNTITGEYVHIGTYPTIEQAFKAYKEYKEEVIKQVAQEEYDKGNITKKCYDVMMNYEVEITD